MSAMTEEEARSILADRNSPAAEPDRFRAERVNGGWAFRWADPDGPTPFGVRTWVVTDSGTADRVKLGENAQRAVDRLAAD